MDSIKTAANHFQWITQTKWILHCTGDRAANVFSGIDSSTEISQWSNTPLPYSDFVTGPNKAYKKVLLWCWAPQTAVRPNTFNTTWEESNLRFSDIGLLKWSMRSRGKIDESGSSITCLTMAAGGDSRNDSTTRARRLKKCTKTTPVSNSHYWGRPTLCPSHGRGATNKEVARWISDGLGHDKRSMKAWRSEQYTSMNTERALVRARFRLHLVRCRTKKEIPSHAQMLLDDSHRLQVIKKSKRSGSKRRLGANKRCPTAMTDAKEVSGTLGLQETRHMLDRSFPVWVLAES